MRRVIEYETYLTSDGDTWDIIAYRKYKDVYSGRVEHLASELMRFNKGLEHYVIFPAGVLIRIPYFEETAPQSKTKALWGRS